ncbi:hypothetical protein ACULNC_11885 [Shigella flexneri]
MTEKGISTLRRPDSYARAPDGRCRRAKSHQPKTATGVIVEALARRKAAGLPAFTVMSCDNMPENGHVMRDVVTSYAQAVDVKLAQWIEDNVTFPSTMVDRIVPQ